MVALMSQNRLSTGDKYVTGTYARLMVAMMRGSLSLQPKSISAQSSDKRKIEASITTLESETTRLVNSFNETPARFEETVKHINANIEALRFENTDISDFLTQKGGLDRERKEIEQTRRELDGKIKNYRSDLDKLFPAILAALKANKNLSEADILNKLKQLDAERLKLVKSVTNQLINESGIQQRFDRLRQQTLDQVPPTTRKVLMASQQPTQMETVRNPRNAGNN